MKLFRKKRENNIAVVGTELETISVPSLKSHLLNEFERNKTLEDAIICLKAKLAETSELQAKYETAMVLSEEYSNKVQTLEEKLKIANRRSDDLALRCQKLEGDICAYKAKLSDIDSLKQEAIDDAVDALKKQIVDNINRHKGNLSRASACMIVKASYLEEAVKYHE